MPARLVSLDELPYARSFRRPQRTTSWQDSSSSSASSSDRNRHTNNDTSNTSGKSTTETDKHSSNSHNSNSCAAIDVDSVRDTREERLGSLERDEAQRNNVSSGIEDSKRLKKSAAIGSPRPVVKPGSTAGIRYKASAESSLSPKQISIRKNDIAETGSASYADDVLHTEKLKTTITTHDVQIRNESSARHAARIRAQARTRTRQVSFAPVDADGAYERLGWNTDTQNDNNDSLAVVNAGSVLKTTSSPLSFVSSTSSGDTHSLTQAESSISHNGDSILPYRRPKIPDSLLVPFPSKESAKGERIKVARPIPVRSELNSAMKWSSTAKLPKRSSLRTKVASGSVSPPERIVEKANDCASSSPSSEAPSPKPLSPKPLSPRKKGSQGPSSSSSWPSPRHRSPNDIVEISLSLADVAARSFRSKSSAASSGSGKDSQTSVSSNSSHDTTARRKESISSIDQAKINVGTPTAARGQALPQRPCHQKEHTAQIRTEDPNSVLRDDDSERMDSNISDKALFNFVWSKTLRDQDHTFIEQDNESVSLGDDSERSLELNADDVWAQIHARHSSSKGGGSKPSSKFAVDDKNAALPDLPSRNKVMARMA